MECIAVTGATGFLGRSVIQRLGAAGLKAVAVVRSSSNVAALSSGSASSLNLAVFDGSVANLVGTFNQFKVDAIAHLATYFVSEHEPYDVKPLVESNVLFGMQIAEAACLSGVTRFVNLCTPWQHCGTGRSEYDPFNLYAATKQAYDDILTYYSRARRLGVLHLEMCDTYGRGDTRRKILPMLMEAASRGDTLDMSPGDQRIDLVHVDDAAEAVLSALALTRTVSAGETLRFSVTSGDLILLRDLVSLLTDVAGVKINVNWGANSYREREIFAPRPTYTTLPNWSPRRTLVDGLSSLGTPA